MSPSAATAAGRAPGVRRSPAPRVPRRVSGPAGPARPARPQARPRTGTATRPAPAPAGIALGAAARRLRTLPDARLLDRLVRGRAWIALVAVALMGIVFMQVSMLQLNAGIGRAVTSVDTLERQNSTLRADISQLDSGERIQQVATQLGMVMPAAGDVRFLNARRANGARAAANITAPAPAPAAATQTAAVRTTTGQGAPAAVQTKQAVRGPAAQPARATAPPATATTASAAAPHATTQSQTSRPQSPTPATAAASTPGAAAAPPATTSAGGVSAPAAQR